jgi:CHAT domain-containing protein
VLLADVPVPFQGCRLPETSREIAAVKEIVPEANLVIMESKLEDGNPDRGGPTVDMVFRAIPDTSILHIASHGIQVKTAIYASLELLTLEKDRDNALQSGFAMKDGMLTLSKLMSLNLPKAFLAILSACDTAKGDSSHPDQVLHLAAAMLFVGFRSVIGTMWYVTNIMQIGKFA